MLTQLKAHIFSGPVFLRSLRRVTSTGRYIPEVDGLRFAAIFSIYLFHLVGDVTRHAPAVRPETNFGDLLLQVSPALSIGVSFFFIISGYVLGLPFADAYRNAQNCVSIKSYFLRRLTRLEPPYLLCLLLFFVLKIAGNRGSAAGLWPSLLASSFYVHNAVFARPSDINFVAWSLEIEVQFYLCVPLLARVFAIPSASFRRIALGSTVMLATALSQFVTGDARLELSILHHLQFFLMGFLLAEFQPHFGERRSGPFWDIACAGAFLLLAVLLQAGGKTGWLIPWMLGSIFCSAFLGPWTNGLVTNPWITTIGGMCYSIYLLHNYVIAGLGFLVDRLPVSHSSFEVQLLLRVLLVTPIVLALGALYFGLVERPSMQPDWVLRILPNRLRVAVWRRLQESSNGC